MAELAYIAFRGGYLSTAADLNAEAFQFCEADSEVCGQILFTQGLIEEAMNEPLRAAGSFERALAIVDLPETRRHLAKLPNREAICQSPRSVSEFCECRGFESFTESGYPGIGYQPTCTVEKAVEDGRFQVLLAAYPSRWPSRNETEAYLIEFYGGRVKTLALLGESENPGVWGITGETRVHDLRLQDVYGHRLVIARVSSGSYDQNGGGMERMGASNAFDQICVVTGRAVRCHQPVLVATSSFYRREPMQIE